MADNAVQTLSRMIAEKMLGKAKNTSGEAEMQARSLPPDPTAKEAVLKRMMLTQAPQRVPYDIPNKIPGWNTDQVKALQQDELGGGNALHAAAGIPTPGLPPMQPPSRDDIATMRSALAQKGEKQGGKTNNGTYPIIPTDPDDVQGAYASMFGAQRPNMPAEHKEPMPPNSIGLDSTDDANAFQQGLLAAGTGKGLGPTPNPDDYADSTSKLALAPGGQSALVQDTSGDQAMEDFLKKNPQAGPMPKPRIATLR